MDDQITVPKDIIHPADRGPELGILYPGRGERRLLTAVRPVPLVSQHHFGRVGRVLEDVVGPVGFAQLYLADLLPGQTGARG